MVHSAETMNLSRACGDKRVTKLLIGTVINIPAASAETVAASAAVAVSAFLWKPLTPATAASEERWRGG
jgi:hypothetical protein